MNQVINFYKRSGRRTQRILDAMKMEPIFKGVTPPIQQTPGRAQTYYPETLHLIPDSVLYKVRMPSRYAQSEDSKKYEDVVQQKTLEFLKSRFGYNLFDPEKGFHLDLTVGEIKKLAFASQKNFDRAESGELQEIVNTEREQREQVQSLVGEIEDTLEDLEEKIDIYEKNTAKVISQSGLPSVHGYTDLVPFYGRSFSDIAIEDVTNALDEDSSNSAAIEIGQRLHAVAEARAQIAQIRLDLVNCWNEHNVNEEYDKFNFEDASKAVEQAQDNLKSIPSSWKGGDATFSDTLSTLINEKVPEYLEVSNSYERSRSQKDSFFNSFNNDEVYEQNPEALKQELYAFLSSNIIIKEHRLRYQAEQYDRYLQFMKWLPVYDYTTLREFSVTYANALRSQVEENW